MFEARAYFGVRFNVFVMGWLARKESLSELGFGLACLMDVWKRCGQFPLPLFNPTCTLLDTWWYLNRQSLLLVTCHMLEMKMMAIYLYSYKCVRSSSRIFWHGLGFSFGAELEGNEISTSQSSTSQQASKPSSMISLLPYLSATLIIATSTHKRLI